MNGSSVVRRGLKWAAVVACGMIASVAGIAAAVDAGHFRGPLIRFIVARTGRSIRIDGLLRAHVFSVHPQLIAEHVSIGNPPWTPPGTTADIGRIVLMFDLPRVGRSWGIAKLEMEAVTLHLLRDAHGRANWQWTDPDKGASKGLTIIRSLSVSNAHVLLDDARRHLKFDGTVSVRGPRADAGPQWLRMDGAGQLNGRAATFAVNGDPLATAAHARPYHFTFAGQSSGSQLAGHGFLSRPFNFNWVDSEFVASGADLKDLYFLTGVTLVNTGSYQLSGKVARRGILSTFSDLFAKSGQSEVQGSASIDTSSGRPKLEANLHSSYLRLADMGARAAGRDSTPKTRAPLLLSDARVSPQGIRHGDAKVTFHARRVEVGRFSLTTVAAQMTIENGVLTVAPLTADLLQGKLVAHVKLDATTDLPRADFDLRVAQLHLAQLEQKADRPPPVEGLLRARLTGSGHGSSIHEIAATANGTATAVVPHGTIRASLAELTGIDLRGLGLMAAKNTEDSDVRCAVASFQARDGKLTAQTLVVDTAPVLVAGEGSINLDDETLDLVLRGHPKHVRLLRVRSPLLLRGTLTHPSVTIQARNSVAQTAEAVALGVILTPLAAALAFVDPGLAKDADCAALIAGANTGVKQGEATPASRPGGAPPQS
jgi:uncharacterized protein involved in outer membrane biogenesis